MMDMKCLVKAGLVVGAIACASIAEARDSEVVFGAQANQGSDVAAPGLSSACKIQNNMPQAGCTDEDLCMFNSTAYAHVCKQVEAEGTS